ncbi:MAG: alcohol dehydrogenase catalytic domain-containing protein [Nanoarchaeota archaeon]
MKSVQYTVVAPEKIEERQVVIENIPLNYVLLKPVLASICQSDLRYFFGRRNPEVLKKKYPLCLLHEGIAEVVHGNEEFKKGSKVVVIPNIPCCIHRKSGEKCFSCKEGISENYCLDVKFMSSNCDGMAQTYFLQPAECITKLPPDISEEVGVLTELLTVTYRAAIEANINEKDKVVVFGCGPTGYLMASLLHFGKNIKRENLYVVDINDEKLKNAKEFATTVNIKDGTIQESFFDKGFECVGRNGSEEAIDYALKLLKPKGTLVLLGVSEEKRAIQTRTILDKGLIIKGTTRSTRQDFPIVLELIKNKKFQKALLKIVCNERFKLNSKEDLIKAFKKADDPEHYGKVLIEW